MRLRCVRAPLVGNNGHHHDNNCTIGFELSNLKSKQLLSSLSCSRCSGSKPHFLAGMPLSQSNCCNMSAGADAEYGKHCSLPSCNQTDFLPFVCDACKLHFCAEHRNQHDCTNSVSHVVDVCEACGGAIRVDGVDKQSAVCNLSIEIIIFQT
jgi:predicted nucleic acid binding AN1-type Zn finger protein